jgi:DNA-binding XRE family transcriptional regulator
VFFSYTRYNPATVISQGITMDPKDGKSPLDAFLLSQEHREILEGLRKAGEGMADRLRFEPPKALISLQQHFAELPQSPGLESIRKLGEQLRNRGPLSLLQRPESPSPAATPPRPPKGITNPAAVEAVQRLRKLRNWSQQKLAEKAYVSVDSIGRLEAGQNMDRTKVWDKVARVLGTTYEKLSA